MWRKFFDQLRHQQRFWLASEDTFMEDQIQLDMLGMSIQLTEDMFHKQTKIQ